MCGRYTLGDPRPLMRRFGLIEFVVGLAFVLGALLVAHSRIGVRVGDDIRALSDRVMLGFLRATSGFERESGAP